MGDQGEFASFPDTTNSMLYNQPDFDDNFFIDLKEEVDFTPKDLQDGYLINTDDLSSVNALHNDHERHDSMGQNDQNNQHKRTRASGEVLALLIDEFNKNPNPNAQVRKRISDQTGMPERSVRIWFQNRRAKSRKIEKAQATGKDDHFNDLNRRDVSMSKYDGIPLNLNNSYYFIDARSLTVGSWKRLKSGNLSSENIFSVKNLSNLSPLSINEILDNSTDLMIVISKKNFEINYFFSAIADDSKILFRIFFPISSVNNCSLSICTEEDEKGPTCESKLYLNKPPKFAVSFANLIRPGNNQWSICDDFSEGHQVNDAFIGGSGIAHVFHGLEPSLKFLNSFILDYNSSNIQPQEFALPQRFASSSPNFFNEQSTLPQDSSHQPPIPTTALNQNQALFERHQYQASLPNPKPTPQINIDANSFDMNDNPLLQQFVKDELIENPDSFEAFINQ